MGWSFLVWLDTCLFPCPRRMKDGRNFLPHSSLRGGYGPDSWAWDTKLSIWCASPFLPYRKGQLPQGRCKLQPSSTSLGSYLPNFSTLPENSFFFFFNVDYFKSLYWIPYNIVSVFLFGFLATRHVGSWLPDQALNPHPLYRWSHAWPCNKPFPAQNSNLTHCVSGTWTCALLLFSH